MSGTRLDRLPRQQLITTLDTMETELEQLKVQAQPLGTGSVRYFISQTADQYDFQAVLPQDPNASTGHSIVKLLVSATCQNMSANYATINADLFTGTTPTPYLPLQFLTDVRNGTTPLQINAYDVPNSTLTNGQQYQVLFVITYNTTTKVSVKFWALGLDVMTLTVASV